MSAAFSIVLLLEVAIIASLLAPRGREATLPKGIDNTLKK